MKININSLFPKSQITSINLGLESIKRLLNTLNNPQNCFPIIHVAGTNGKGSVCAYLSSILTESGYKVGRFTSPHLIDWNERICINEQPISTQKLTEISLQINQLIEVNKLNLTQFEIITAVAFLYFYQENVDIAVIEVGLGGRLDSTNVCDKSLISIITSISKDHEQYLGSTLAKIAAEKAGILKQNCPAIIGKLPMEAQQVIESKIKQQSCPYMFVEYPQELKRENSREKWLFYDGIEYPLNRLGNIQLLNSAIAIASIKILQEKGWKISLKAIQNGMRKTQWRGRIEWVNWRGKSVIIDGAHNPDSAKVLREYVDTLNLPIIWIIGMLNTKDHTNILKNLLSPKDELYLVPIPEKDTANPQDLAQLTHNICPNLVKIQIEGDLFQALNKAIIDYNQNERLIIICGSLYLIGYFLSNK